MTDKRVPLSVIKYNPYKPFGIALQYRTAQKFRP
jgi:hypothetical protein